MNHDAFSEAKFEKQLRNARWKQKSKAKLKKVNFYTNQNKLLWQRDLETFQFWKSAEEIISFCISSKHR